MPRRPRFCPAGIPVHVIQRGNNRQTCFVKDADIAAYASWLAEYTRKFRIDLHAWVFMTNHVHMLLTPQTDDGVSKLLQSLGRQYVRYFNYAYTRSGTLFEGRYKSSLVQQEQYLLSCQCYIELNPVRAGMVKDPGDYRWSSYRAHAFGVEPKMWSPHSLYEGLGVVEPERRRAYRALIGQTLDAEVVANIRHCSNTGVVLGTDKIGRAHV